ncbi:MAG: polysaccharide biosynthesis/export family protein [Phycisphaerae bacterium]|nr:polysaccharide biosynthesis/export family protein [Phycisphaerae bacterium]
MISKKIRAREDKESMGFTGKINIVLALVALSMLLVVGCSDPTSLGSFRSTPMTNVILDDLGVVDEKPQQYENARLPEPRDLLVDESEYVISSGDVLDIGIQDLFQAGLEWQNNLQVSDTGRITLPELGTLFASGLTELEFTRSIEERLKENQILREPIVRVVVIGATKKVYTVDGQVPQPNRYQITEPDLRIIDALAAAGGLPPHGVDYAYVIRNIKVQDMPEAVEEPTQVLQPAVVEPEVNQDVQPVIEPEEKIVEDDVSEQKQEEQEDLLESVKPFAIAADEELESDAEMPFKIVPGEDGFKVEGTPDEDKTDLGSAIGEEIDFTEQYSQLAVTQEVIKIDLRRLRSGDLTQNIVVRSSDRIIVPLNVSGEFFVTGQVNGPGPYSLRGERMTLKQGIATSGGFGMLACPSRCDITRRIGDNQEVTVNVNLQKIFEGTHPDIYLRPGDMINVGSHPLKRWEAVIRQSFRATYGFGFVYDRNIADKDFGN